MKSQTLAFRNPRGIHVDEEFQEFICGAGNNNPYPDNPAARTVLEGVGKVEFERPFVSLYGLMKLGIGKECGIKSA